MTECRVTCYSGCRNTTNTGPKVWHWLCECCAEECQEDHRRQTGCAEVHLEVLRDGSMDSLLPQIRSARQVLIRRGW